jgi:adenine-specific DNA-methyltransferase
MENIQKFQDLLKKLFQFEASDLDFGIYRILNYKRDRIEKFIQEDLVNKAEEAFAKHKDERLTNINQRFESAKEKIIQSLGKEAFTPIGELKEEFKNTPLGRDFLTINAQKEEAEKIDEIKLQVFNDLYNFFSRYYEEGDFVPQYRYSIKGYKYAIPYNGEEVKLYWANSGQYYTKTGLLFRDYTFKTTEGKNVIFRVTEAEEELGSNKATKERFFVLDDEMPVELNDDNLIIRLQYRELNETEVKYYDIEGGSNISKQGKTNEDSFKKIMEKIEDKNLKLSLNKPKEEGKDIPLLRYHIERFTAKNTMDYFIHKNLKKFLTEQLDYFIKAEVLDIETLEKERFLDKHITRAKVVREIGEDIIDFLSQIEDFQKRLWEKKKFVIKTDYVITNDRVPEEFYDEIWKNKEQKKEWNELGFEIPKAKEELKDKKLLIDTKHFSTEFKEKLLEKLTEKADLDDALDGLLIKSDNWQALNLLWNKYKGEIKCIYIDPPFNSKSTEILYRNFYKHSSWLSLMENRILLAREFLERKGVFICAIDENEQEKLGLLIKCIFNENEYLQTLITILHNPSGIQGENFSVTNEYAYFVYPNMGRIIYPEQRTDEKADVRQFMNTAKGRTKNYLRESGPNCFYPILVKDFEIIGFGDVVPLDVHPKKSNILRQDGIIEIYPIDDNGVERKWVFARDTVGSVLDELTVRFNEKKKKYEIIRTKRLINYKTVWFDSKYSAKTYGTNLLNALGIYKFSFPKSLYNVLECIKATTLTDCNSTILDFFAGSGTTAHAVMKLNKEDGGKRKFILVEMADYFDTVIIPRIKKVAYSFNWKDGKPLDTDGIGVFFKYQILEQYEDTLDNIELKENQKAHELFKDEYLLKYFLEFETRESPYLLNIDHLKNPFAYKLKVNLSEVGEPQEMVVDVPETFNYLLGLKVKKIKARGIATHPSDARNDKKRKYLFILGEKEGKDYVIVWREYDDNWSDEDFKKDKEFIIKELSEWKPYIVYVNGQSVLTPKNFEVRVIEPEFKRLMEG